MTRPERKLLRECSVALDRCLHLYAPEQCNAKHIGKIFRVMMDAGGTLAYIADLQQRIRKTLRTRA